MLLKKWEALPEKLRVPEVRKYYDILAGKKVSLVAKRIFDVVVSGIMLIILSPVLCG